MKQQIQQENQENHRILLNIVKIFEQIKQKKINVKFVKNSKEVKMAKKSGQIYITLGLKEDFETPKTKLERILSYIVFDSTGLSLKRKIPFKKTISEKELVKLKKHFMEIYNILEQRRVESCYGAIYNGTLERFIDSRKQEIERDLEHYVVPKDPISALKLANLELNDLVLKSSFPSAIKYIEAVEKTGKNGSFKLTLQYWKKVVEPFLFSLNIPKSPLSNSTTTGNHMTVDDAPENDTEDKSIYFDRYRETVEELENIEQTNHYTKKETEQMKEYLDFLRCMDFSNYEKKSEEFTKGIRNIVPLEIQDEEFDDVVSSLKETGQKEIQSIEQQITDVLDNEEEIDYKWEDIKDDFYEEPAKNKKLFPHDKLAVKKLRNSFKKITGGSQSEIDSVGSDIDIESYIDFKIQRNGNFLVSSKNHTGFDIVIAVDESGSMDSNQKKVKRMCANLFEAISTLPNTNLTILGWHTGDNGVHIKKITKKSQINSLNAEGGTPLAWSLLYAKNYLEKMSSQRRLLIFITDGCANDNSDIFIARDAIQNMRKKGIMCTGIWTSPFDTELDDTKYLDRLYAQEITEGKKQMDLIFGKDYAICRSFDHVDTLVTSDIKEQILKNLKKIHFN